MRKTYDVRLSYLNTNKASARYTVYETDKSRTLDTQANNPSSQHGEVSARVRKLTPTECERLQGLPDGYTDIEFKGKPASDARRYKAIGNGMAQPCADFVLKQLVKCVYAWGVSTGTCYGMSSGVW